MLNSEVYMQSLLRSLQEAFGNRLIYLGLQGSYRRGEADEHSDIDAVVVLDSLSPADLIAYRHIVESIGNAEKSCGFICGQAELAAWNPLEAEQFLRVTQDIYGNLEALMPARTREDTVKFVKLSLNNLYHELCHRFVHADRQKNISHLPGSFRAVFFILQNLHWLRTGRFIQTKAELLSCLSGDDRWVLETSMALRGAADYDFDECFGLLFRWCQSTMLDMNII